MSGNELTPENCGELRKAILRNQGLETLKIDENDEFGTQGIYGISKALSASKLKEFSAQGCEIKDKGGLKVLEALEGCKIVLEGNMFSGEVLGRLVEGGVEEMEDNVSDEEEDYETEEEEEEEEEEEVDELTEAVGKTRIE